MSKKSVAVQKESGAHSFNGGKNHDKPFKGSGAHHNLAKHELPKYGEGLQQTGKPIVHIEDVTHHSGRPHPPATRLADSKILKGKLRKSDA